jgi:hypothetical protein
MATFTEKSHALNVYAANDLTYLKISQDASVLTRMNIEVKNTSDGSNNNTVIPHFRSLTFTEGASLTTLSTRFAALDTSIATNAANIVTNTTNIASNGTNIATNSTAILTEAGARATGDASLQSQIDAANTAAGAAIATLTADLATETTNREIEIDPLATQGYASIKCYHDLTTMYKRGLAYKVRVSYGCFLVALRVAFLGP